MSDELVNDAQTPPTQDLSTSNKRYRDYELDPEEFGSEEDKPTEKHDSEVYPSLYRQDAKTGDSLISALSSAYIAKSYSSNSREDSLDLLRQEAKLFSARTHANSRVCGRKLKNGKKCQHGVKSYGMCNYHFRKWKRKNPQMKAPGSY